MKTLSYLEKSKNFWFLVIASFIFFLFRLPSLFEPYWYGDEGITQVVGVAIRSGRLLYRDIVDNKPPLLYLLYSLFNSDQFSIKLISLIFGLLSVIAFFILAKKLFGKSPFVSTSCFAILFGLPLIEGNIANAENFMLFPTILAAFLIVNIITSRSYFSLNTRCLILFFAGLLVGLSLLFKAVALFDFAAFFLFVFFAVFSQKNYVKLLLSLSSGFILPLILTIILLLIGGNFKDFLQVAFIQNVSYIGQGNKMLLTQFPFLAQITLTVIFLTVIFKIRGKISTTTLFVFLWSAFSLFNLFLSARHYTHYLLVFLPSFLLLAQLICWDKRYQKISFVLFITAFILVLTNFNFYFYPNITSYYQNFASFIIGAKDVSSYQAFFDKQTPIDYKLVQFINSKSTKKDSLFLWGNNAQVYKMTNTLPPGKYSVAYHISYYKDGYDNTRQAIKKTNPRFIIIMPNQPSPPFSLINYENRINIDNVSIYERIF